MKHLLSTFIVWLVAAAVWGQSIVVPPEVQLGQKIVATCDYPPPEGTRLTILWNVSAGLESEQAGTRLFLWGPPGRYSVDAVVIPLLSVTLEGKTFDVIGGEIRRLDASFTILGNVPPGPGPDPNPQDAPFPAPGFAILILHEAQETGRLTEKQKAILTSQEIRKYLHAKCVKLEDGSIAARFWDDDYTQAQLSLAPQVMQRAYFELLEDAAGRLPWIGISDGRTGFSGPLPGTVAETLALLKKYGG